MTAWLAWLANLAWSADPEAAPPDPEPVDWGREASGERGDPFRPKVLRKLIRKVVPAVERAAGRPFLTPPVVEVAAPEPFDAIVREETALIYSSVYRDTPPELRERIVSEIEGALQPGLLGKYGIFEDTLYLCPDSIRTAAASIGAERLSDVVTVILAHELVHALHDQHGAALGRARHVRVVLKHLQALAERTSGKHAHRHDHRVGVLHKVR
ncbi:MAG: hypothetical protein AAF211_21805, partial [Myxococcota bacterium]